MATVVTVVMTVVTVVTVVTLISSDKQIPLQFFLSLKLRQNLTQSVKSSKTQIVTKLKNTNCEHNSKLKL